jgi:hypothetical protein
MFWRLQNGPSETEVLKEMFDVSIAASSTCELKFLVSHHFYHFCSFFVDFR